MGNSTEAGGVDVRFIQLVQHVKDEVLKDRVFGRAAELAYYLILALFPFLICMLTVLTFFPGSRDLVIQYLSQLLPAEALVLIQEWVGELFESRSGAVLSFGLVFTLWSASAGVAALMDVLNAAYKVKEERTFLKTKITALLLTISLALLVVIGVTLVIYGRPLVAWIFQYLDLPFSRVWSSATYVAGIGLLMASLMLTYNFAPNVSGRAHKVWPGALFAVAGILLFSFLFSMYLRYGPSYSATYGSLGAVVVLMLWLYFLGVVIIIGAEINSELTEVRKEHKE